MFFSKFGLSVSYLVFKRNLLISILFTLEGNLSYTVFVVTSFFTTSLSLIKSTGAIFNYQHLFYILQLLI